MCIESFIHDHEAPCLFKIIYHGLRADAFEYLLHEFNVQRMELVGVLRCFVAKNDVKGDLIGLIHHRPVAARHLAYVKVEHPGDWLEILVRAGNEFIRSFRIVRVGPKNNNV